MLLRREELHRRRARAPGMVTDLMANYVDGYVFAIAKSKIAAYKRIATKAARIWKKHGALEYRECIGDDARGQHRRQHLAIALLAAEDDIQGHADRAMGLQVVAEGVETEAQSAWLREQGCDAQQGFLCGEPMSATRFEAWLRQRA